MSNKNKELEEKLTQLLDAVASSLAEKIRTGEATHQDFKNAIELLKNNGITCEVQKGEPLDFIQEKLPFQIHSDHTFIDFGSSDNKQ